MRARERLVTRVAAGFSVAALLTAPSLVQAQTALPQITIKQPKPTAKAVPRKPAPARKPVSMSRGADARRRRETRSVSPTAPIAPGEAENAVAPPVGYAQPGGANSNPAAAQERTFNAAQDRIFSKVGANSTEIGRKAIEALPQGDNQPFDKLLLQTPGVTQDSAASGNLHIRNEHANVQIRINGILLPDGISGFGQFLETSFVGKIDVVTGALPAEYGLHTAALLDIQTRNGGFEPGGDLSLYGGGRSTITPSFDYGGHVGTIDYYVAGRFLTDSLGIENPTSSLNAIHDRTYQGKFFGYASGLVDPDTRVTVMSGTSIDHYQIPNTPGIPPSFAAFGQYNFNSSLLNENQVEQSFYNVVAAQRSVDNIDAQLSFFSRYSTLRFTPDPLGDLIFNGVASNVYRSSFLNGVSGDAAYRFNDRNTLRFGFTASAETTKTGNVSTVLPLDADGNPIDAPFSISDPTKKTGYLVGAYAQDEFKITNQLTVNAGLRFDQMFQYVDANQLSPRVSVAYQPFEGTVFHAGYARNFTPPEQALAAPTNLAIVNNTTQQPAVPFSSPVQPERSNVFDIGITQRVLPGLDLGVDGYYKTARNLLDDGQFGQALVLTAFNYAKGYNDGVEFKANYVNGNFLVYGNLAIAQQRATQVASNQFLFDPDELSYISNHYVYTDHTQIFTASAGLSYLYDGTRYSADMIYGSGLRSGFANTAHVPGYVVVNAGLSHEFQLPGMKPTTLRFDVVNLFDENYEIRDGSGIGVFAPQFGQRRTFLAGLSQKF